jgi:hypothetical protein
LTKLRRSSENMRLLRDSIRDFREIPRHGHLLIRFLVAVEQYYVTN